jgi:hypothetical protein
MGAPGQNSRLRCSHPHPPRKTTREKIVWPFCRNRYSESWVVIYRSGPTCQLPLVTVDDPLPFHPPLGSCHHCSWGGKLQGLGDMYAAKMKDYTNPIAVPSTPYVDGHIVTDLVAVWHMYFPGEELTILDEQTPLAGKHARSFIF